MSTTISNPRGGGVRMVIKDGKITYSTNDGGDLTFSSDTALNFPKHAEIVADRVVMVAPVINNEATMSCNAYAEVEGVASDGRIHLQSGNYSFRIFIKNANISATIVNSRTNTTWTSLSFEVSGNQTSLLGNEVLEVAAVNARESLPVRVVFTEAARELCISYKNLSVKFTMSKQG